MDSGILLSILLYLICACLVVGVVYLQNKKNRQKSKEYWDDYQTRVNRYTAEKKRLTKGCIRYAFVDSLPNAVGRFLQNHESNNADDSGQNGDRILVFDDYPPVQPQSRPSGTAPPTGGFIRINCSFNISDVLYWAEKGSLQYTSHISGGGANISGAVIGGLVAGDAGAVIASRNPIQTRTVQHDTRRIVIKMHNAAEYEYPYAFYQAFIQCMPEKEYEYLKMSDRLN